MSLEAMSLKMFLQQHPHPQTSNDHLIFVFQLAPRLFLHGDTLAEVQSQKAGPEPRVL